MGGKPLTDNKLSAHFFSYNQLVIETVAAYSGWTCFCLLIRRNAGCSSNYNFINKSAVFVTSVIRFVLLIGFCAVFLPKMKKIIIETLCMLESVEKIQQEKDFFIYSLSIPNFLMTLAVCFVLFVTVKVVVFYKNILLFSLCMICVILQTQPRRTYFSEICFFFKEMMVNYLVGYPDKNLLMISDYK